MLDFIEEKPIKFYIGDESRVVIEKDWKESIFNAQYERAIEIIKSFWSDNDVESLTVPNIVAFCGDRGEGKTSCMLSTKNVMKQEFGEDAFEMLETIDPSFFDEAHNIIELVLGQLYSRFLIIDKMQNREELLKSFNRVKSCLSTLTKGTDSVYDAIEELDELGNSMTLKDLMEELLTLYLEYCGKKKLVVVIDDMDYNWKRAYEMTQLIFKYLCHRNCILLISISINQMVEVVDTSFKNELKIVGNRTNFYEVAYKYVEKLIPLQYRVDMPHVYDLCNRKLDIYEHRGDESPIAHYNTIKEGVVNEIFRKTRYLFYNYHDGVSQIVPRNLRMLRQLLGLLIKMDIYHKDSGDLREREKSQQNKVMFQSYFFTNWTRQLNRQNRDFVKTIMDVQDISQINKLVVGYMKNSLPEKEMVSFRDIISPSNYSYNVSVGDVFSLLNYIERNPKGDNDQLMVFFLKSYYSMLLYHYYDEITSNVNALHSDEESGGIYRTESWFKGTNKLQRFVNGCYFQYNPGDLIKGKIIKGQKETKTTPIDLDCDQFSVDRDLPALLLQRVLTATGKQDQDLTEEDKADVLLAELFILMVSWGSEHEIGVDQKKQRDFPQPHHLLRFNEQTASYMFDIMAPFCNLINPQFAYNRFKWFTDDLYHYAYEHDWSLLRQMMAQASGTIGVTEEANLELQEMNLASDAIIRNAEVLTSMKEKIQSLAISGANAQNLNELIASFYEKIMNSEMETYPTAPHEKPYTINFRFLKPIIVFLRSSQSRGLYSLVMQSQILRMESGSSGSSI